MFTCRHPMTAHASFTGPLFTVDEHTWDNSIPGVQGAPMMGIYTPTRKAREGENNIVIQPRWEMEKKKFYFFSSSKSKN